MRCTRTRRMVAAAAAVAMAATVAEAQGTGGDHRQAANAVFERALRAYASVRTYQHVAVESTEMVGGDGLESAVVAEPARRPCRFLFKRPDRIAVQCDDRRLVYDGRRLWQYNAVLQQYTVAEVDMGGGVEAFLAEVTEHHSPLLIPHAAVLVYLLVEAKELKTELSAWDGEGRVEVRAEAVAGEDGTRIAVTAADGSTSSSWYGAATGLLGEVRLPLGAGDPALQPLAEMVTRFEDVVTNAEIGDDVFRFEPGEDDTEARFLTPPPAVVNLGDAARQTPQATVPLAGGSLEELGTDRLGLASYPVERARGALRGDVDGDGRDELIVARPEGGLVWLSTSSGAATSVPLASSAPMRTVRTVEPLRVRGELRWLLTFEEHGGLVMSGAETDEQPPMAAAGLYDAEGRELWYYQPELPAGTTVRVSSCHGDLDGDGVPEVVVGLVLSSVRRSGDGGWRVAGERSLVVILDVAGNRLVQKRFDGSLEEMVFEPARSPSDPARVVCLVAATGRSGGSLETLTLHEDG